MSFLINFARKALKEEESKIWGIWNIIFHHIFLFFVFHTFWIRILVSLVKGGGSSSQHEMAFLQFFRNRDLVCASLMTSLFLCQNKEKTIGHCLCPLSLLNYSLSTTLTTVNQTFPCSFSWPNDMHTFFKNLLVRNH